MKNFKGYPVEWIRRLPDGSYVVMVSSWNEATPYAVWNTEGLDSSSSAYWGHYCETREEADAAFEFKVKKAGGR